MALADKAPYTEAFLRVFRAYPAWPTGRTKKILAFRKFETLRKTFKWTDTEIQELVDAIELQKRERASWQKDSPYGPQGLQVWLNQHGWEAEYEKTTKDGRQKPSVLRESYDPWDIRGISKAEWEAEQDWIAREQMRLPQSYNTLEAAMAAARLKDMNGGVH